MQAGNQCNTLDSLFSGNGEMAALMRAHDWTKTPLGPVEHWPQSLRTTLSIILNSGYPMFVWWGKHYANLYNDAYRPVLGASKHPQFLGQSGKDCWSEIWDAVGGMAERVMTAGEPSWAEDFLLLMDRYGYLEETYFTFSYSPVRDETGGVGGIFCACIETTKQVLGERRLRTLRDLAAQAGEAKDVDVACKIAVTTLANNPADLPFALLYLLDESGESAHLVGVAGLEAGTPASPTTLDLSGDLSGNRDLQPHIWPLHEAIETNQAVRVEQVIERFGALSGGPWDESPHTALIVPVASHGQARPTGLLVAGISPRRALDDDYQGFLELVASQIASAIADARAYEVERQRAESLAEIDRAKTLFFSNVSHEFRTPLTLLLAPAEDALADTDAPLAPAQRDRIHTIHRNALRLLKLVNTLLDFSRIEAGRIEAVYEPTDVGTLTAELASTFRSLIERAGLDLIVDCPPLAKTIYLDREMWEKIVFNLLSNAFKFTLTGSITVGVRDLKDRVELTIADTGIGIPKDELPRLFERFHRIKGSQGRSFEGSGIGLSLVQELVKLHGGAIAVTSSPGRGTCFQISLPTGSAHLPANRIGSTRTLATTALGAIPYLEEAARWLPNDTPSPPTWDSSDMPQQFGPFLVRAAPAIAPASILVVDDNSDMRDYLRHLLEQRYSIRTAQDGIAALEMVRQSCPDLVLTDVMMPRLDGFGLLRELRASPQTREIPIILLSARAGEESRVEGLEAGADDYLTKPFSTREMLARVEANLKMAQVRRETARAEQMLRRSAEEARHEAEAIAERMTQILENMHDAFVSLDADWRVTYQNRAAEHINNDIPRSQTLGKTHWEVWPASVGSEIEIQYRRAVADQVPIHFEHHYYDPPHYAVWLEIHACPFRGGLNIFFRDISDRKQAEATLHDNQIQLQQQLAEIEAIYQSAPVGLNVLDANLRFVRINRQFAEMNGRPMEAHLGRTLREVLPDLADTLEGLLEPLLQTGVPLFNVEISGETSSQPGVERTWLEHFSPLKNGETVIGISTVCEEITERKIIERERQKAAEELRRAKEELEIRVLERTAALRQSNAELHQSESTLRSFFNSGAMLMGIIELCGKTILHISDNVAAARFLKTTPEAMKNQRDRALGIPQKVTQAWIRACQQAAAQQSPVQFEYCHSFDSEQRWLAASVSPITVQEPDSPRFSYIVEDITQRKLAEAEHRKAEEQIEASLREKEVLLKEIHHRVKNNLGIVSGLLQMQVRRNQNPQANIILRDSQNRIASIALVHEKLYRSDDLANIDFSQYVRDLVVYLFDSYDISSRQIALTIHVENVSLDIETAIPCGLVINELVSNALKHAFPNNQAGQIQIHFSQQPAAETSHSQRKFTLMVRDDGIGLPVDLDIRRTKTLGMALIQGLVRQIGGQLEIHNQTGTTFIISFTQNSL
ncbi:signal transduction histidine kinase [Geitlerinema sp. PCC 7407]|nr:signal transduction histidine kinase [Geitlerinema sp. PCC 7407]